MRWLLVGWLTIAGCGASRRPTPSPSPSPPPTPSPSPSPSPSADPSPEVPALLLDLDAPLPLEQVRPAPNQRAWLRRTGGGELELEIGTHHDRIYGPVPMSLVERAGDEVRVVEDGSARLLVWVPAASLQRVVTTDALVTVEGFTPGASKIDAGITLLPGYPVDHIDGTLAYVRGIDGFDFTGSIALAATGDSYVPAPAPTRPGAVHEAACDTPVLSHPGGARLGVLGPGKRCHRQAETYDLGSAGKGRLVMYVEPHLVVRGVVSARRLHELTEGGVEGGVVGGVLGGVIGDPPVRAPAGTCLFDALDGRPVGVSRYELDVPDGHTPGWHPTTVTTRWGAATVWVDNGPTHGSGFRPCARR